MPLPFQLALSIVPVCLSVCKSIQNNGGISVSSLNLLSVLIALSAVSSVCLPFLKMSLDMQQLPNLLLSLYHRLYTKCTAFIAVIVALSLVHLSAFIDNCPQLNPIKLCYSRLPSTAMY